MVCYAGRGIRDAPPSAMEINGDTLRGLQPYGGVEELLYEWMVQGKGGVLNMFLVSLGRSGHGNSPTDAVLLSAVRTVLCDEERCSVLLFSLVSKLSRDVRALAMMEMSYIFCFSLVCAFWDLFCEVWSLLCLICWETCLLLLLSLTLSDAWDAGHLILRLDFACLWQAMALDSNVATCAFRLDFVVGFVCRSTLLLLHWLGFAECGCIVRTLSATQKEEWWSPFSPSGHSLVMIGPSETFQLGVLVGATPCLIVGGGVFVTLDNAIGGLDSVVRPCLRVSVSVSGWSKESEHFEVGL
eukprot:g28622.t1